jgi:signal transduction histidine kinase
VAVRAALEVLTDRQASATGRDLMARCTAELSEMSRLVDDILHWGIVGESPRPRRLDIVPIVRESVALCGEELGRHRFSFVAPDHAIAFVEPVQLRGAIINLLRNAALYSPDDGMIKAEVEVDPDRTSVIVRDSGPGIPAAERETIFLPYVRGSRAASHAGKGLGLFIARRVAEATGGRLVLVTEGSTEFRLEVPRDGAA